MNLEQWQTVIQEQRVPHQIEVQSRQVESTFSHHDVDAQIFGGSLDKQTIRFDLSEQVEAGKELLSGIKDELLSIFGVSSIQFSREKGHLQLQIERPIQSPVPLVDLITSIEKISQKTAVIGLDEEGHPLLHEFNSQTRSHVLIQGSPGAGKSSLIKTIGVSLAMLNKQSQLQLVTIAPTISSQKTLLPLNYLPHMLEPIIKSILDCGELFTFLEEELQYRLSQNCATPTIVVLFDEIQSLFDNPQIINQLHYLLQNGPNAGIYFVLAHDIDDNNHLPEMIKANIPLQIVGQVPSSDEAQKITGLVDTQAELLNGKGDFLTIGVDSAIYFHGAFINNQELVMIVDKLHRNRPRPILAQAFAQVTNLPITLPTNEEEVVEDDSVKFEIRNDHVSILPIEEVSAEELSLHPISISQTVEPGEMGPEPIETIAVIEENKTLSELSLEHPINEPDHKPMVVKKPVIKLFDQKNKVHLDKGDDESIPFDLGAPPDGV